MTVSDFTQSEMINKKRRARLCACRCGEMTFEGEFCEGHDAQLYVAILSEVGGLIELRRLVEEKLGRKINSG